MPSARLNDEPRQVVVTGIAPLTPIGTGKEQFWDALLKGESGVRRVDDEVDLSGIDVKIGAPIDSFDPSDYIDRKRARRVSRATQFGLAATSIAIADAGLNPHELDSLRTGVIAGTGIGGLKTIQDNLAILSERGPRRVSPLFVPRLMPNALAGQIAIEHGLRGANIGVVSACASSTHAIGIAGELIRSGFIDSALAGGSESVILRIVYAAFARIGALSKRNDQPTAASRPFDMDRDGFVIGEGAGFLMLEERTRALERGATIYAELASFGMSADATHITAPAENGEGAAHAISMAIDRASVDPIEIAYINSHGTSTRLNDVAETRAIKSVFGQHADSLNINSTKSQIGHLLGAAGAVEAIATILSMQHETIPATLNYNRPDPECDLDYTKQPVHRRLDLALSNSFGFGGQNGTLIFRNMSEI